MNIESMIYKDPTGVNPKRGDLLIAEPLLDEPYFKRSVVVLLDDDPDGGQIGLVLNRSTPVNLQDLFPDWKSASKIRVYCGGPVEADRLFMLHSLPERFPDSMEISTGLYVGAKLDDVIDYINNESPTGEGIRFFLGYSGWTKGQLTSEILRNTWALCAAPQAKDLLIGAEDEYWRKSVERLGKKYRSWLIVPSDPSYN